MSTLVRFSIIALFLLGFTWESTAQKVKELPKSITWNLHPQEREEFFMKDFTLPVSREDSAIWRKPNPLSVNLTYLKPSDFGFGDGFQVEEFVAKVKQERGALPCPEWVPVQLFMFTDHAKEALWIPTPRTANGRGEMARLGKNPKSQSEAFTGGGGAPRMDIFRGNPQESGASSIWVFVIP